MVSRGRKRVPSEVEHKKLPVLVMSPKAELEKCAFNYVPVDLGSRTRNALDLCTAPIMLSVFLLNIQKVFNISRNVSSQTEIEQ